MIGSEGIAARQSPTTRSYAGERENIMIPFRTVAIQSEANSHEKFREETGAEYFEAIGYLASWAISSEKYAHCTIWLNDSEMEMTAIYRATPDGETNYVIGAVWRRNERRFSFHS